MRIPPTLRSILCAVGLLLAATPALARDTVFTSPAMRSPVDGALQCTVFNASVKKPMEGITLTFRRVDSGTAGAVENCGSNLQPGTGCMATLAGFCEDEACACVFTMSKGSKKAFRGTLMTIDSEDTVTGAVELRR